MLHIHSVYATYAPPLICVRETRQEKLTRYVQDTQYATYATHLCSWVGRETCRWPQLSPAPPQAIPAQYHYCPIYSLRVPRVHYYQIYSLRTQYTHKLTTTVRYILTSYPGTTKYIYCCPIYPPSLPVYRCSRIKPRPWYVKAEHLISSANDPICSFRDPAVWTAWPPNGPEGSVRVSRGSYNVRHGAPTLGAASWCGH